VYTGHDAKLQELSTEASVGSAGRGVRVAEISKTGTNRQVSSTEQSVPGAEHEVLSTEKSMHNTGAQSV
jgi:hypothetical protein